MDSGSYARLRWSQSCTCLLYTSDAADERSSVDLGGRRIIKKKKHSRHWGGSYRRRERTDDLYDGRIDQADESG